MNKQRIRRSQLACPQCGRHQIGVRSTITKGGQTVERYRVCEACRRVSKTREQFVSDYRDPKKFAPQK